MPSFFQAHRDEVITMVANPVVDQVVSAGLGESKFFVLSITPKRFIMKNACKSYILHAQSNVNCARIYRLCASKSSSIIFTAVHREHSLTFLFSICCETTAIFTSCHVAE